MAKADQRKPKKFSENPARRHHYIPVFYLNSWARNNGQLVEFSKPHEKVIDRFRYPKATGFLNDLYTIRELPLELQTWLEEYALRQIDDLAASSYQVFLKGVVPTTEALRSSWSRFILSLIHRSPESLERLKLGYYREVEKNQGESEKAYLASRGENDPETYEEALKKFAPHSRARLFAKLFTDLIDNEYLGTRLNRMFWQVIVFQNRPHLLTSDRPIVMTNGFAYHDSHICLALSPTRLFIATNTQAEYEKLYAEGVRLADLYNDIITRQASKFVFGCDCKQLQYVEDRLGRGPVRFIGDQNWQRA